VVREHGARELLDLAERGRSPVTYEVGDERDMRDPKHRRVIRRWLEEVGGS